MATRMSSKVTARPKTLNRGADDAETRILAYLRKRKGSIKARFGGLYKPSAASHILAAAKVLAVNKELTEDIAWIENISERAGKRKGGLGK